MLKIKTGAGVGEIHEWKIGQPRPMNKVRMAEYPLYSISEIVADGDEYAYVRSRFKNLPIVDETIATVKWGQPFAQFIYDNLI